MRKKLDTRFPAARIKKIMQADEDVGKIAMAVPVLVSKALELFLQDLCDRTYDITVRRGAKTVNSLHLKHCVQSYNVFDFLREVVSKVPDYGHSDAGADDRTMAKRRKVAADELNESDEESKRSRMNEAGQGHGHISSSGRGRGQGRGRGRGRGSRLAEREAASQNEVELDSSCINNSKQNLSSPRGMTDNCTLESKELPKVEEVAAANDGVNVNVGVRNFDLNAGLDENAAAAAEKTTASLVAATTAAGVGVVEASEVRNEDYPIPGWSLSEMDRMAIDPLQLAHLNSRLDEEDEDYDDEA